MAEVLAETNLLPANVLFIDDNPVNRAEMQAAYPEMRILGGEPHLWRHILLLAPETQPAAITVESEARTEMVQAQIRRETERKRMSSEEFLQTLDVRIQFSPIAGVDDPRFARVLELINKTNQFNTTGKRWTLEECVACFVTGVEFHAFEVTDRFTKYGLVGVLILTPGEIRQFVMSCRVMGLLAEAAAVAYAVNCLAERGDAEAFAQMIDSVRNLPCRGVYLQAGFEAAEGGGGADDAANGLPRPHRRRPAEGDVNFARSLLERTGSVSDVGVIAESSHARSWISCVFLANLGRSRLPRPSARYANLAFGTGAHRLELHGRKAAG